MSKEAKHTFKNLLLANGHSEKVADELWKWYDFSEKRELQASNSLVAQCKLLV